LAFTKGWKLPLLGITEVVVLDPRCSQRKKRMISPEGERIVNLKDDEVHCIGDRPYFNLDADGNFIEEDCLKII